MFLLVELVTAFYQLAQPWAVDTISQSVYVAVGNFVHCQVPITILDIRGNWNKFSNVFLLIC